VKPEVAFETKRVSGAIETRRVPLPWPSVQPAFDIFIGAGQDRARNFIEAGLLMRMS
jgi:hypothetical protein